VVLSIKTSEVRGEGGCPVRTRGEEGFSDEDVRTFVQKPSEFSNLWCLRTDKGVECCKQGGGVSFSRFCTDVFYERFQWLSTL